MQAVLRLKPTEHPCRVWVRSIDIYSFTPDYFTRGCLDNRKHRFSPVSTGFILLPRKREYRRNSVVFVLFAAYHLLYCIPCVCCISKPCRRGRRRGRFCTY